MHNCISVFLFADVAFCADVRRSSDYAKGILQECDRGRLCHSDTFEDSWEVLYPPGELARYYLKIGIRHAGRDTEFLGDRSHHHSWRERAQQDVTVLCYHDVFTSIWGLIAFSEITDGLSILGYIIIISMVVLKWRNALKSWPEADMESPLREILIRTYFKAVFYGKLYWILQRAVFSTIKV